MSIRSVMFRACFIAVAVVIGIKSPLARGAVSEVSGRVLKPDGQPAPGATVYVYRVSHADWSTAGIRARVTADSRGRFKAGKLMHDRAQQLHDYLVAIYEGFGLACWSTRDGLAATSRVDLRLTPETVLTGSVRDVAGRAIENAWVVPTYVGLPRLSSVARRCFFQSSRAPLPSLATSTDARGRFALGSLPKVSGASVSLRVFHSTFAGASWRGKLQEVSAKLDIVLEPGCTVEGTVTHEGTGRPRAGVQVQAVRRVGIQRLRERGTTDERGRYRIDNLPAGSYTIRVAVPEEAEWTAAARPNVLLRPNKRRQVDLTLIKGLFIRGQVVDAGTGTPVAGVTLSAYDREQSCKSTSAPDGSFRLRCPSGVYRVRVSSVPEGYIRPDWGESQTIALREGADAAALEFAVAKGVTVQGKVVDQQGMSVAGIRVETHNPAPTLALAAVHTDREGGFRLTGLMPTMRRTLMARDLATMQGASTVAEIKGRDLNGVVLRMLPLARVTGRVVDFAQAPVSGAEVLFCEAYGNTSLPSTQVVTTRLDGSFEFLATPGVPFSIRAREGARRSVLRRIVAEAGAHHEWGDIVASTRARAQVAGRVERADGQPVPGARVTMWDKLLPDTVTCNSKGEFRFDKPLAVGDRARLAAKDPKGLLVAETTITIKANMLRPILRLERAGALVGRVVNEQRHPIRDASVTLRIKRGRRATSPGPDAVCTDQHGRFRYAGLVPGQRGQVSAEATGYGATIGREVVFRSGKQIDTGDLVLLKAESSVAGRVTDADGRPLVGVAVSCYGDGVGQKRTRTDAQGRYRFDGIPKVDELLVRASSADYGYDVRHPVKAGATDVDLVLAQRPRVASGLWPLVGRPAPDLAIGTWLNTEPLDLKTLRGKVVLLHFWTMYSRPCLRSLTPLKSVQKQFPNRLAIIAVHDRSVPEDEVKELIKDNGVTFPVAIVKSSEQDGWAGKTFRNYRVKSLPATFLIDKKGILRQANLTGDLAAQVKALIEE